MARSDSTAAIGFGLALANAALVKAAGLAITALSFELERHINERNELAASQCYEAKRALIDAVEMAKRATDAGNKMLEARS